MTKEYGSASTLHNAVADYLERHYPGIEKDVYSYSLVRKGDGSLQLNLSLFTRPAEDLK